MFAFASCDKETEMTKMISADRVEFTGNNSDLFEINADSVMVKLIPIGVNGDEWEVRTILPISNTEHGVKYQAAIKVRLVSSMEFPYIRSTLTEMILNLTLVLKWIAKTLYPF